MNSRAMARTWNALESLQGARLDLDPLRHEIARIIRPAVPNEGWSITSVDPDALLPSSAVADLPGAGFDLARLTLIEYASDDVNLHRDLMRRDSRVGVLSQSTGGDLHRSDRGREIYQPSGIGDELRAELAAGGRCWGTMDIFRERSSRRFSDEEADFTRHLAPRIARLLRGAQARTTPAEGATGGPSAPDRGPGVVVLDGSLSVVAATPDARRWIGELAGISVGCGRIPLAILAAVAAVQSGNSDQTSAAATGPARSSRVRALSRAGRWITISAAPFNVLDLNGQPGHTAVTLQRSGPEAANLVLEANGLTPREHQIAGLVLGGLSNDQIARKLYVSRHTVGDHVKAILRKIGARSKQEFIASILGRVGRATDSAS